MKAHENALKEYKSIPKQHNRFSIYKRYISHLVLKPKKIKIIFFFSTRHTTILEWKMTTPPIVANSLLTFDYKPNGLSGKDNGECKFIWSIWRVKENLLFSP